MARMNPTVPVLAAGAPGTRAPQPAHANKPVRAPGAPRSPARSRIVDEELGLDLPEGDADEHDTSGAADDTWEPGDDADLGLEGLDGDDDVGLDTSTGTDDTNDADLDLDDSGEGERWTKDSEATDELDDGDDELGGGAEYGWTGDDDAPADDESFDPDLNVDERGAADDGGVEGLDDEHDLDDFDEGSLPRLDASGDETSEDLVTESLDEFADASADEEPTVDVGEGVVCRRLPSTSVRVTALEATPTTTEQAVEAKAVVDEDGALYEYCCIPHGSSLWLVRRPVQAAHEKPLAFADLGAEFGPVTQLVATFSEGLLSLRVSSATRSVLVEASLDGEQLA